MIKMRCNNFNIKIFVEDTDFQGYVYHANYLKYFERARSQFLNDYDISQVDKQTKGLFVIKDLFIKYVTPAKLENELIVITDVSIKSNARLEFNQSMLFSKTTQSCCEATINVCYVDKQSKKPIAFENKLLEVIKNG